MNIYDVTISYDILDTVPTLGATIKIRRKASTEGVAAAIATQIFSQLGNYIVGPNMTWFRVNSVTVSLVQQSDNSQEE